MKKIKLSLLLIIPAITAGLTFTSLYFLAGSYLGHIHDVYASNTQSGLIPLLWVVAGFLGGLPMAFYVAHLLFTPVVLTENESSQVVDLLSSEGLQVGQVFNQVGTNCKLRVKSIKRSLFQDADFSGLEYLLQFSF